MTVFDLSDTFDDIDPAKLEIAAWDDHPNVVGHHRLFLALARALVKDHEVYQLLFPPWNGRPARAWLRAQALAGKCESGSQACGLLASLACEHGFPGSTRSWCGIRMMSAAPPVQDGCTRMDSRHLSNLLEEAAARRPDHTAVEDEHGRRLTYAAAIHESRPACDPIGPLGRRAR